MGILSLKRTLATAILLFLFSSSNQVAAQDTFTIVPTSSSSTFPECGVTCPILLQAQDACVPPQAAVTTDSTYISCFCQSAYLTGLKSSGAICTTCTSASDQQLLETWYNGYCAGGYTSTLTNTATATTTSSSTTSTGATTTTASSSTSTSTGSASGNSSSSSASHGWFSTHWRWVVMLIVLVIGFSALAVVGAWWKKRMDARHPGLYHGDDRNNTNDSGSRGPGAAAAFFSGSLRNLSRSNVNSTNNPSTTNNSANNVAAVGAKVPKVQQQPSMSMTSNTNRRSSLLSNRFSMSNNNNNVVDNNNNYNNNHTWGPNQARDLENVAPVDEPVFRNSMATAAAAAAFEKSGGTTGTASTANNSRTDVSSIGTGGGAAAAAARPGSRSATPRNPTKLSTAQSASNLHQQSQQNFSRVPPRPRSATVNEPDSPVSPI